VGLIVLFLAAAVANFSTWVETLPPTGLGAVVSTVGLLAWPIYAVWRGRQPVPRGWLFPTVFWVLVAVIGLVGWWAASGGAASASGGYGIGLVLLFWVTAPFHGVTAYVGSPGNLAFVIAAACAIYAATMGAFGFVRLGSSRTE
jgi:hypothetical protein